MMGSRSRIGYLVPGFPTQTHAFSWREICAIGEVVEEVKLISIRRLDTGMSPWTCRGGIGAKCRRCLLFVVVVSISFPIDPSDRDDGGIEPDAAARRFRVGRRR